MKRKEKIIIPFVGLKEGKHEFDFKVGESFFKEFEFSIIESGQFDIELMFHKKKTMFELDFQIHGIINTECYRCGDAIDIEVEGQNALIVKFGESEANLTDDILYISSESFELDLTEVVYEFTNLLMPKRPTHDEIEDCNPKVIAALNKYSENKKQEIDPRWEALSKLK